MFIDEVCVLFVIRGDCLDDLFGSFGGDFEGRSLIYPTHFSECGKGGYGVREESEEILSTK
jgi:hypothetical protein